MSNIFSKKPLWAVVFAAAAIFAVTFVACDSSTTNNIVGGNGIEKGDAVEWVKVADGATYNWVIAKQNGFVPSIPDSSFAYYTMGKKILAAQLLNPDSDVKVSYAGENGAIYEVWVGTITGNVIAFTPKYLTSDGTAFTSTGFSGKKVYVKGVVTNIVQSVSTALTVPSTIAENGDIVEITGVTVDTVSASTTGNGYNTVGTGGALTTTVGNGTYYTVEKVTNIVQSVSTALTVPSTIAENGDIVKITGVAVDTVSASTTGNGYNTVGTGGALTTTVGNGTYYTVEKVTNIVQSVSTTLTVPSTIAENGDIVEITGITVDTVSASTTGNGYNTVGTGGALTTTVGNGTYYTVEKKSVFKASSAVLSVPSTLVVEGDLAFLTAVAVDAETAGTTAANYGYKEVVADGTFTIDSGKYCLVEFAAAKDAWYGF